MRFKGDAECARSRGAYEAVKETYFDVPFARTLTCDRQIRGRSKLGKILQPYLRLTVRVATRLDIPNGSGLPMELLYSRATI